MYCNNCGKKVSGKKCSNCNTNAKIKNTLFGDYIFDYGKDKAKDTLFNKIVYFINNYLYGIVFTIMVVATVLVTINVNNKDEDVLLVDSKPKIAFESYPGAESIEALLDEIKISMKKQDVASFNSLYIQNYIEEYQDYEIYERDLTKYIKDGVFINNDYETEYMKGDQDSFEIEFDELKYLDGKEYNEVVFNVDFYDGEEKIKEYTTYFVIIEYDDKYYLLDYVTSLTAFENEEEVIAYSTTKKNEANLPKGKQVVDVDGKDGKKKVFYNVTYSSNGDIIKKEKVSEEIITESVTKVVRVGTSDFNLNDNITYSLSYGNDAMMCKAENFIVTDQMGCGSRTEYNVYTISPSVSDYSDYLYKYVNIETGKETKVNPAVKLSKVTVSDDGFSYYAYTISGVKYAVDIRGGYIDDQVLTEELCAEYHLACGRW